jgi:uncharacterized protein
MSRLNWDWVMMLSRFCKRPVFSVFSLLFLFWPGLPGAEQVTLGDCRQLQEVQEKFNGTLEYSDALLWKIEKEGHGPSHIFGTIHVSDPGIVDLPEPVSSTLNTSESFVMEALPEQEEIEKLKQMMDFEDGRTLKDFLDEKLFYKTADILSTYQISREEAMFMKPWAAFLVMNYPAEQGLPLDLQLLNIAWQNGAKIHGLESLSEQGDVFNSLQIDTQIRFLLDTVCNYEIVSRDFEKMKSLYLERDLKGLFDYSNKYTFSEEPIYKELIRKLLIDRNYVMVERMQSALKSGNAFIAIGAMHLPGREGVLALLEKHGYTITSVY